MLLAGLVYLGCALAVIRFGVFGDELANTTSIPTIMARLFGEPGRWAAALVGYLACFASINIYLQGFARLLWSLADEGKLPAGLARLNRNGAPLRALAWVVILCALCALASWLFRLPLDTLIRYANGNFILVYLLAMIAGVKLLSGFWRALAAISALLCLAVLLSLGLEAGYALALGAGFIAARAARPLFAARRQLPQRRT